MPTKRKAPHTKGRRPAASRSGEPDRAISLSTVKAARILRAISLEDSGLTLSEVVSRVGLPTTVCHRLLTTLEREGFVDRDRDTARFRLGAEFIALARRAQQQHPISLRTAELMARLAKDTRDVALLMVEDHEQALCIDRIDGDYPVIVTGTQIGSRLPLHCGGGPFAILAFSPDPFIDEVLSRPLGTCTSRTVTDPRRVRGRIAEARARGFTIGDEDLFEHVVAVGAPVFGPRGRLLGAISVGGVKPRYDARRIAEVGAMLRDAVARLSADLR